MTFPRTREREYLDKGLSLLRPPLLLRGFAEVDASAASSSGGQFAAAAFRRGAFEIGLIVRNRNRLGCPNYSMGSGYIGHDDLLWALDAAPDAHLIASDSQSYQARDGGDAFRALCADWDQFVLPALDGSETAFRHSLKRALIHLQEARGW